MKTPDEIKKGVEYLSIKDITKKLEAWHDGIAYDYAEDAAADALAYIQQLEAQVPKWISVEERLPEYGRYLVIIQTECGMGKVITATYNDMGWWTYGNSGELTHWMPLPEPPKED